MLRRFFSGPETATAPDPISVVERLLRLDTAAERSTALLRHLAAALPGDVRGYTVTGGDLGSYRFEAVVGYPPTLLTLTPQHGPWREPGPRLVANLIAEMFTPNPNDLRSLFGDLGLRDAKSSLVVPVGGDGDRHGTLILHRHDPTPFGDEELRQVAHYGAVLGQVQAQAKELHRVKRSLIEFSKAFVEAMEAQDFTQLGHAQRVTAYALAMGRALNLPKRELADLYFAAMLHDIGKLGSGLELSIEDTQHPQRGANLVASSSLLERAADGIRGHHENWDGSGFPSGLRKEQIPLLARLVAVADVFDLLSSERGQALPLREVEKGLEARSGRELDPSLVTLFINILRQGRSTAELAVIKDSDLPF